MKKEDLAKELQDQHNKKRVLEFDSDEIIPVFALAFYMDIIGELQMFKFLLHERTKIEEISTDDLLDDLSNVMNDKQVLEKYFPSLEKAYKEEVKPMDQEFIAQMQSSKNKVLNMNLSNIQDYMDHFDQFGFIWFSKTAALNLKDQAEEALKVLDVAGETMKIANEKEFLTVKNDLVKKLKELDEVATYFFDIYKRTVTLMSLKIMMNYE